MYNLFLTRLETTLSKIFSLFIYFWLPFCYEWLILMCSYFCIFVQYTRHCDTGIYTGTPEPRPQALALWGWYYGLSVAAVVHYSNYSRENHLKSGCRKKNWGRPSLLNSNFKFYKYLHCSNSCVIIRITKMLYSIQSYF